MPLNIPIDFAKAPYREKYLDETPLLEPWCVFGSSGLGTVDIAGMQGDVFIRMDPEAAGRMIAARNTFLEVIHTELCRRKPG